MTHEDKLSEVFKQLAFLQYKVLKDLPEKELDALYDNRPFKDTDPTEETDFEKDIEEALEDKIPEAVVNRIKNHLN